MISVLLTILKILGIVILSIIAFALLLALAILFVPVRYRAQAKIDEKEYEGNVKASWLLHFLSFKLIFVDKKPNMVFRVLGIPIKKSSKEKENEFSKDFEPNEAKDLEDDFNDYVDVEEDKDLSIDNSDRENIEPKSSEDENINAPEIKEKKPTLKERLKKFSPKNILEKIKEFIEKIKAFIKDANQKKEDLEKEYNDPKTKEALEILKTSGISLLKHYKPRKLKGFLEIGFDDPANTGMLIGFYYMLFPVNKEFNFYANFNQKRLNGDLVLKGHIRLVFLVKPIYRIFKNEKLKQYLKK